MKLRTLIVQDSGFSSKDCLLWSPPPLGPLRQVELEPGPAVNQRLMLKYNAPDIIGYSLRWSSRMVYLHAHVQGKDLAFYQGYEQGLWVYFPLERGEKILEIWTHCQFRLGSALIVGVPMQLYTNTRDWLIAL